MLKLPLSKRLYLSAAAFVVLSIGMGYFYVASVNESITFAEQEKRGNAYQRPLNHLLYLLGKYDQELLYGEFIDALQSEKDIEAAFTALKQIQSEYGEALQFTDEGLSSRGRDALKFTSVYGKWQSLSAVSDENGKHAIVQALRADVFAMISHAGDTSNLILDPDLDSYYLMDITLLALPQAMERLNTFAAYMQPVINGTVVPDNDHETEMLRYTSMTQEADISRVTADVEKILIEDKNFYGKSETLKITLNEEVPGYINTARAVAENVSSIMKTGIPVAKDKWLDAVEQERNAIYSLMKATVDELDKLLDARISAYKNKMYVVISLISLGFIGAAAFFYWIILGIRKPLNEVQKAMEKLANQQLDTLVPHQEKVDEIGDMARALQHFKANAKLQQEMQEEKEVDNTKRQARANYITERIQQFETVAKGTLQTVGAAIQEMRDTAYNMNSVIANVSRKTESVATAAAQTTSNVNTVAMATEELSASTAEIAAQISHTSQVVDKSVNRAGKADVTAQALTTATVKIGEAVQLIEQIAGQINLLALNATIESACAGAAGKGFAVVANEIKVLAGQTSKATEEISKLIQDVQNVATEVVGVMQNLREGIGDINQYTSGIAAAVEEQSAVTREIASNMQRAASSVNHIDYEISDVSKASHKADSSSQQVLSAANTLSEQTNKLSDAMRLFLNEMQEA